MVELTDEQQAAVAAAERTIRGEGPRELTIGGLAGTGKTTIIKAMPSANVAIAAFTGRAVSVLRRKGVQRARTLHSLMYTPREEDGKVVFDKVEEIGASAVIVDEASMLSSSLLEDLRSFGVPIVFVGDHGQLEPIGDNPNVLADPDIRLERIHRQAADSPILRYAHIVRGGMRVDWGTVPPMRGLRRLAPSEAREQAPGFDVVVCGFNRTRKAYNALVRKARGLEGQVAVGDRVVCLRNSRLHGAYNGEIFTVTAMHGERLAALRDGSRILHRLDLVGEDGRPMRRVEACMVDGEVPRLDWVDGWGRRNEALALDHGYALTCHKAQGGEFGRVLVVEEIWWDKWDPRRWRYTAATRAAEELAWVG